MRSQIFANTKAVYVADQVSVSAAAILTQFLVARMLGLSGYGYFSILVLTQLFLLSVQQAAFTGIFQVVYPAAGEKDKVLSGIWSVVTGYIFFAGLLIVPVIVYVSGLAAYAPILIVNVLLFLLQDFFRRILMAQGNTVALLVVDIINNGLQVVGLIGIYLFRYHSLSMALWVCGLSYMPALIIAYIIVRPRFNMGNARTFLKEHRRESGWMALSSLLQWFAGNFYVMAAGWWLGAATLGLLRLAQYAFGLVNVMLQAIDGYIVPKASLTVEEPAKTMAYLQMIQKKLTGYLALLALPAVLMIRPVATYLHADNIDNLMPVVYGLSIVYLLIVITYPLRIALRVLKMGRTYFIGHVINAVFGFCTAKLLIDNWQLNGVLTGLFLSQAVLLVYWTAMLQKKYRVLWK